MFSLESHSWKGCLEITKWNRGKWDRLGLHKEANDRIHSQRVRWTLQICDEKSMWGQFILYVRLGGVRLKVWENKNFCSCMVHDHTNLFFCQSCNSFGYITWDIAVFLHLPCSSFWFEMVGAQLEKGDEIWASIRIDWGWGVLAYVAFTHSQNNKKSKKASCYIDTHQDVCWLLLLAL